MKTLLKILTLVALATVLLAGCGSTFEALNTPGATYTLDAYSNGHVVKSWQISEFHTASDCIYFQELPSKKWVFISEQWEFISTQN